MSSQEACKLCGSSGPLRLSHIVPRFVYKWLRETGSGRLRSTDAPNWRRQDGPKRYWLCDSCEQLLCEFETPFFEQVFRRVHARRGPAPEIRYQRWALKFAASISWRTLLFRLEIEPTFLCAEERSRADQALRTWGDFILGRIPHPGEFEQHILLVDESSHADGPVSPWISRYLLRGVDINLIRLSDECLVHTKMCRVVVLGFLCRASPKRWRGTKLHVASGHVGSRCKVPAQLSQYWNYSADITGRAMSTISEIQQRKTDDAARRLPAGTLATSDAMRALHADVLRSGRLAFGPIGPADDEGSGAE
jgi:hypothetical protein